MVDITITGEELTQALNPLITQKLTDAGVSIANGVFGDWRINNFVLPVFTPLAPQGAFGATQQGGQNGDVTISYLLP